jgi:hypothetical protein
LGEERIYAAHGLALRVACVLYRGRFGWCCAACVS